MNGFDPGEGWRMEQFEGEVPTGVVAFREDDGSWSYWVREAPVPPLPNAPYTVIRPTWPNGGVDYLALHNERWWPLNGSYWRSPTGLAEEVAGFEVLAEPRAVTAKAFMLRLETLREGDGENWREQILREFGVES